MRIEAAGWDAGVYVDGARLELAESLALVNHSPTGFSWGYRGSGPAQLALAILLAAGVDDDEAVARHHAFLEAYVERWPQRAPLDVDVDVAGWLELERRAPGLVEWIRDLEPDDDAGE